MQRNENEVKDGVWTVIGVGTALLLGIAIVTVSMVHAANPGPHVGDMVRFDPGQRVPDGAKTTLFAARADQPGGHCAVAIEDVAREGGSFVIESHRTGGDRAFQTHWAGGHTADGAGDCGRSADLVLDASDVIALAQAAGGFGVTHPGTGGISMLPFADSD